MKIFDLAAAEKKFTSAKTSSRCVRIDVMLVMKFCDSLQPISDLKFGRFPQISVCICFFICKKFMPVITQY
jgi:hypothetical protein